MTGTLAILCAGQGGQHSGMFNLVENHPEAEPVFAISASLLGTDPREYVRTASPEQLYSNRAGQILCCTLALALRAVLPELPDRIVCAGYSVGELSAWGIAGCLTATQILHLVALRANLMDKVSPADAGLAGITGLPSVKLTAILNETGTFLAISNAQDSVVIGGMADSLNAAIEKSLEQGAALAKRLAVAVPSHTPLLRDVEAPLLQALRELKPKPPMPGIRLLSGLDGEPIFRPDDGCLKLAKQIDTTVQWGACLQGCREADVTRILDTGPGTALARMARSVMSDIPTHAAEDFHSIEGLSHWIAGTK